MESMGRLARPRILINRDLQRPGTPWPTPASMGFLRACCRLRI